MTEMNVWIVVWIVCVVINFAVMTFSDFLNGEDTSPLLNIVLSLTGPMGVACAILYGLFVGMVYLMVFLDSVTITFKKKNPNS